MLTSSEIHPVLDKVGMKATSRRVSICEHSFIIIPESVSKYHSVKWRIRLLGESLGIRWEYELGM